MKSEGKQLPNRMYYTTMLQSLAHLICICKRIKLFYELLQEKRQTNAVLCIKKEEKQKPFRQYLQSSMMHAAHWL